MILAHAFFPGAGKGGTECGTPVTSVDFFPTILDMIGRGVPDDRGLEGVSLAPLLRGEAIDDRALYWHFPHYSNHGMQSPGGAVRAGDYKLLEYFDNNSVQLFNLRDDIGEQKNLAKAQPAKVAELRAMLHTWRKEVGAKMPTPK